MASATKLETVTLVVQPCPFHNESTRGPGGNSIDTRRVNDNLLRRLFTHSVGWKARMVPKCAFEDEGLNPFGADMCVDAQMFHPAFKLTVPVCSLDLAAELMTAHWHVDGGRITHQDGSSTLLLDHLRAIGSARTRRRASTLIKLIVTEQQRALKAKKKALKLKRKRKKPKPERPALALTA